MIERKGGRFGAGKKGEIKETKTGRIVKERMCMDWHRKSCRKGREGKGREGKGREGEYIQKE